MLRRAAVAFLVLHGIAHVLGFLGSWKLGEFEDAPYTTLVLNGTVDVGDIGIRLVGLVWLVAASAFVVAGVFLWQGRPSSPATVAVVAALSLVVCVVGLPAVYIGVAIDLAILAILAALAVVRPGALRPAVR